MQITFAQEMELKTEPRPLKSIYVSILGDGSMICANYDQQFKINEITFLSTKLGLGYGTTIDIFGGGDNPYLTVPHHITFNFGKRQLFLKQV